MKLNEFIIMEKPWAYNFEFECGDKDYINLKTPLMRYFIYKTYPADPELKPDPPAKYLTKTVEFIKNNFGYRPVYDPDGVNENAFYQIVIEIYNHLWSWNCPAEPKQRKDKYAEIDKNIFGNCFFGPDTMNSVQIPLSSVLVDAKSLYRTINKYYDSVKEDVNESEVKKGIIIDIDKKEKIWNEIVQYIDWYHTLGNFVLVPAGFNGDRAKNKKINDFCDLSLRYLKKNGYKNEEVRDHWENNRCIYRTVAFDKDKFNEYINYFFLWDYVKHKDNDYIVRSISHIDWGSEQLSPDFFVKTRDIIEHRGRFMTAMLMIEQADSKLYKNIRRWLLKNDNGELPFFDGMNDAAGKILKEFENKEIPQKAKEILEKLM